MCGFDDFMKTQSRSAVIFSVSNLADCSLSVAFSLMICIHLRFFCWNLILGLETRFSKSWCWSREFQQREFLVTVVCSWNQIKSEYREVNHCASMFVFFQGIIALNYKPNMRSRSGTTHRDLSVSIYPAIPTYGRDTTFTVPFFLFCLYVRLQVSEPGLYGSVRNFARWFDHISDRFSPILGR